MTASGKRSRSGELATVLERVLVASDLTAISDRVLGRAARLPLAQKVHVTLLHVVPDHLTFREQALAVRDARKALRDESARFRSSLPRSVRVDAIVKVGSGAKEIARAAKACAAELVVMGRGSGRAIRDTFLGSTAERVTRLGQLPVLTVRLPARASYRAPALALDFDESAPFIIAWARRILSPPLPRITVIHAVDSPYQGVVYPSLSSARAESYDSEQELRAVRKITNAFERAQSGPSSEEVLRWRAHVRLGSPRLVIGRAVKRAATDLLVLGTHGRAGLAFALLGTVAGDVLRDARCDVLVVPPRAVKRARKRASTSPQAT